VAWCVEKNSFQSLAKNRKPSEENQGSFFRKGISGDWKTTSPRAKVGYSTKRPETSVDTEASHRGGSLLEGTGPGTRNAPPTR
jgi:hypothetical protein